jgi:hypothetical protein
VKRGKRPADYARDLHFHLGHAAECARLIERSGQPIDVTDRAKRIGQGSKALRGLTSELQEVIRGRAS